MKKEEFESENQSNFHQVKCKIQQKEIEDLQVESECQKDIQQVESEERSNINHLKNQIQRVESENTQKKDESLKIDGENQFVKIAKEQSESDRMSVSIKKKFRKELFSKFAKAIKNYELLKPNDKVAVCVSGGKDSMLMAKLFQELKTHNKFPFDLVFLVMDPGYSAKNREKIENNAKNLDVPINIFNSDIFENVVNIEKSPCYICARMRRGHLYNKAKELGCNKIALGHHFDDVIETILMGILYGAQVQTMMPKIKSKNFEGMELIRPMYLIREKDIIAWRDYNDLSFLECACKFTEQNFANIENKNEMNSKRKKMKNLIANLAKEDVQIEENIFKSVENVNLATVITYKDKKGVRHNFLDDFDS